MKPNYEFIVTLILRTLFAGATLCGVAYYGGAAGWTYLPLVIVALIYGTFEAWSDTSSTLWSTIVGGIVGAIALLIAGGTAIYFLGNYQEKIQTSTAQITAQLSELGAKNAEIAEKSTAAETAQKAAEEAEAKLAETNKSNRGVTPDAALVSFGPGGLEKTDPNTSRFYYWQVPGGKVNPFGVQPAADVTEVVIWFDNFDGKDPSNGLTITKK